MNVQDLLAGLESGEIDAEQVGWQVVDPDGNVVQAGGVTVAELTSDFIERLEG